MKGSTKPVTPGIPPGHSPLGDQNIARPAKGTGYGRHMKYMRPSKSGGTSPVTPNVSSSPSMETYDHKRGR